MPPKSKTRQGKPRIQDYNVEAPKVPEPELDVEEQVYLNEKRLEEWLRDAEREPILSTIHSVEAEPPNR